MDQTYDRNREEVARLIYKLERFTVPELTAALRDRVGENTAIDSLETIEDYLSGLAEYGMLRRRDDRFEVIAQKISRSLLSQGIHLWPFFRHDECRRTS